MTDDRFLDRHDPEMLKMENELLLHEIAYLKTRLSGISEPIQGVEVPAERLAELEQAENELRWLLSRLSRPPVGWIARRRSGLRALMERYL